METAVLDEVVAKHNRENLAEEAEVHTIRSKDGGSWAPGGPSYICMIVLIGRIMLHSSLVVWLIGWSYGMILYVQRR